MSHTESLYLRLGVEEDASHQEIKQAYKKAALRTHPDRALPERKAEAEINFKKIAEAYEILSEPESRRRYNLYGTPSSPPPASSSRSRRPQPGASSANDPNNTFFGVSPDSMPFSFQWESSYDSARRAQAQRGSGNRRHFGMDPFQLFNEMFEREFQSPMGSTCGGAFDDHPFFANHRKMADSAGFGFGGIGGRSSGMGGLDSDLGFGFDTPFASQGTNASAATRRNEGGGPFGSSSSSSLSAFEPFSSPMMASHGGGGGGSNFQSESRSSRTVNGRTETVIRKVDGQGNETIHTISPESQQVHVNGVEQPGHPLLQGNQASGNHAALPGPGRAFPF